MKLVAVLVIALGWSGLARADEPRHPTPRRQQLLERFDTNHDGRLERRERRAMRRLRLERRLIARFDADADGNLGPGELPPRIARKLRRLDRNRDGWIDHADR